MLQVMPSLAEKEPATPGNCELQTLYIGGGTPTVLPTPYLGQLVVTARRAFSLPQESEITVEANPGTVAFDSLRSLRDAGVNRLSLGIQSFDDQLLHVLGRRHTAAEARYAWFDARAAGFDNLNLDLILGLPEQTLENWQESVHQALELQPEHLSLYALSVEAHTPLSTRIASGVVPPPDDDLAADMYEWAAEALSEAGYAHYEISNWAMPGHACQHNLIYWRNEPYVGLGAGAHSWWNGKRWANLDDPRAYVATLDRQHSPIAEETTIDCALEMGETMMMGLRLLQEGVSFARFKGRFGVPMETVYGDEIAELIERGLLERTPERVRLTQRGCLLGNQVFAQFLPLQNQRIIELSDASRSEPVGAS
jgi:oxygen-independent coproporphyrinogen-3 oxidase